MKPHQRNAQHRQPHQSAIVRVFGTDTPVLQGEILNLTEGVAQIWLDHPLGYASLVRIEYDDNLVLGEAGR